MQMERSQAFTSANGATIGYRTVGSGPAVIVIPGVLSIAADFDTFADVVAESFTVHTLERRGRGGSGPQDSEYCMAIEREDVIALQKKTHATFLFGHSYGGLIALETARDNALVKKVAVYEPGISVNGSIPTTWASTSASSPKTSDLMPSLSSPPPLARLVREIRLAGC